MENIEHNTHITYRVYAAIFNGKKKTAEIMEYLHLETEYRAICASLAVLTQQGVKRPLRHLRHHTLCENACKNDTQNDEFIMQVAESEIEFQKNKAQNKNKTQNETQNEVLHLISTMRMPSKVRQRLKELINLISEQPTINRAKLASMLGVSLATVARDMQMLRNSVVALTFGKFSGAPKSDIPPPTYLRNRLIISAKIVVLLQRKTIKTHIKLWQQKDSKKSMTSKPLTSARSTAL